MQDFWRSSGFRALERNENDCLVVSDEFLRFYLLRPELAPVEGSCASERALHTALLTSPRSEVDEATLGAIRDPDAAEITASGCAL